MKMTTTTGTSPPPQALKTTATTATTASTIETTTATTIETKIETEEAPTIELSTISTTETSTKSTHNEEKATDNNSEEEQEEQEEDHDETEPIMVQIKKDDPNKTNPSYLKLGLIAVTIAVVIGVGVVGGTLFYSSTSDHIGGVRGGHDNGGADEKAAATAAKSIAKSIEQHSAVKTANAADAAAAASQQITEGRLFQFELASLNDGSTGTILINTRPSWAPVGVQQFEKLIDSGFYNDCRFFRVVPNFVVQFGISGDPEVQRKWKTPIRDDPVKQTNERGTMTFATSGPGSRTTQLFINTGRRNGFLDSEGFSPFAKVVSGMDIVDMITSKYREKPGQGKITKQGNPYLESEFPDLSYVQKVTEIQN